MKGIFRGLILFLLVVSTAVMAKDTPELILKTKLDKTWGGHLLKKIKTFMLNNELGDFTQQKFNEKMTVVEEKLSSTFQKSDRKFIEDLTKITGLDINNIKIKLDLYGLNYKIKNMGLDLKAKTELDYEANFNASGVCIGFDNLILSVHTPTMGGEYLPVVQTRLKDAFATVGHVTAQECLTDKNIDDNDRRKPIEFTLNIMPKPQGDKFNLKILKTSFSKIRQLIAEEKTEIKFHNLDKSHFHVDDIEIEFGGMSPIIVYGDKIEDFVLENKDQYLGILMTEFVKMIDNGFMSRAVEAIDKVQIDRNYWIKTGVWEAFLNINRIRKLDDEEYVTAFLNGGFCLPDELNAKGNDCLPRHSDLKKYDGYEKSKEGKEQLRHMKNLIDRTDSNLLVSASEDYINELLTLAFKDGTMEESVQNEDEFGIVSIGNDPGFVLFNKDGNTATFYMQIKYKPKKLSKLINFIRGKKNREILVPIKAEVSMRIDEIQGIPHLVFGLESIEKDKKFLLKGDKYMKSTLGKFKIFNKRAYKETVKAIDQAKKMMPEIAIELPEIKGLGLENVEVSIDKFKRANFILK